MTLKRTKESVTVVFDAHTLGESDFHVAERGMNRDFGECTEGRFTQIELDVGEGGAYFEERRHVHWPAALDIAKETANAAHHVGA